MLKRYFDSAKVRQLSVAVRSIGGHGEVLFHGTRYPGQILGSNTILVPDSGIEAISFTRSPEVAAYWAILPRDRHDELPGVFVFDRSRLRTRYKLEPFNYFEGSVVHLADEMEERIVGRNIEGLERLLIGLAVLQPSVFESGELARAAPELLIKGVKRSLNANRSANLASQLEMVF